MTRAMDADETSVLLLSLRRIERSVGYSLIYEFEDVVSEVAKAERIDTPDLAKLVFARRTYKAAYMLLRSEKLGQSLAWRPPQVRLERDYDLFLTVVNHPGDLFSLATLPNWRERSRKAVCFICEMVGPSTPKHLLAMLKRFDRVYHADVNRVDELTQLTGRPCEYLPLAADVPLFAPDSLSEPRSIDVSNIGRRSPAVHKALIKAAEQRRIFYYYDTVAASGATKSERTFDVESVSDHRALYAGLLRRTRYFIANRARFNQPELMQGRHEIAGRFYEGIAGGAVLIGEPPATEEFKRQFGWPDAIVPMPAHIDDPMRIIEELDAQPQRVAEARRRNIRNAALRHDWVYRLAHMFDACGLPHTKGMIARSARLRALAEKLEQGPVASTHLGQEVVR
jgi:hypothetical protein